MDKLKPNTTSILTQTINRNCVISYILQLNISSHNSVHHYHHCSLSTPLVHPYAPNIYTFRHMDEQLYANEICPDLTCAKYPPAHPPPPLQILLVLSSKNVHWQPNNVSRQLRNCLRHVFLFLHVNRRQKLIT